MSSSKTISRGSFLRALALGLPVLPLVTREAVAQNRPADASKLDPGNLRAFVDLARSDIRAEKSFIIAQNINFTSDEAVDFWPVQKEYEEEVNKLLDERFDLLVNFSRNYGSMTEAQATDLTAKTFDIETKRTDLKRKYFKKFRKTIPAIKATRYFQIENQINLAVDLQIAAYVPLIK